MADPKRPADPSKKPKRRRRRRRRGGKKAGDAGRTKPEQQGESPQDSPAERDLHAPSLVDTDRPADEPLTPAEAEEMQRHLAFMREFRGALRLKLNAKEDLLVNGARQSNHRGTCKYLLSKVDRAAIAGAIDREPLKSDLASRVRFLAGGASITGNLGILLRYLDALATADRKGPATRTFATTVAHIDFDSISAARMSLLLDVIQKAFPSVEHPSVLFGLLQSRSFRQAFDDRAPELKEAVAEQFVPLRAVDQALNTGGRKRRRRNDGPAARPKPGRHQADLEEGLRRMFASPEGLLGYTTTTQERLLDLVLSLDADWPPKDAGVLGLLDTFAKNGPVYQRVAFDCATRLARMGVDAPARELLTVLAGKGPHAARAKTLLAHLERPRIGRIALEKAPSSDDAAPLRRAFWLATLEPVLVRLGARDQTEGTAREARLQADVCLPGVADMLDTGAPKQGHPYVVVPGYWRLDELLRARQHPASLSESLLLAREGVKILRALALAGATIPDAAPNRFVYTGEPDRAVQNARLLLADFRGAHQTSPQDATQALGPVAVQWCHDALAYPPFRGSTLRRELPDDLRRAMLKATEQATSPQDLVALLS